MKISFIGTGYVGLVSGTCMAELGHDVICMDINKEKIETLKASIIPIYEPDLEEMVYKNQKEGRLEFTCELDYALQSDVIFIAVDTPTSADGSADTTNLYSVVESIAWQMNTQKIIVNKSTAPIATCRNITQRIADIQSKRNETFTFSVVSNPEFLREGSAVYDFMNPDRIVIGSEDIQARETVASLYQKLTKKGTTLVLTDSQSAEMIKYASNTFLATKLAFINEISNLCECIDANIKDVSLGMGLDKRIGKDFLKPGPGFGGSCFPKDMRALVYTSQQNNCHVNMISTAIQSNEEQKKRSVMKIEDLLSDKKEPVIAVFGLAFKGNTDDIRESPAIHIVKELFEKGYHLRVYDPQASQNAKQVLGDQIYFAHEPYDCVEGADILTILTEWEEFKSLDYHRILSVMNGTIVTDFRNLLDCSYMTELGFRYYGTGFNNVKENEKG